MPLRQLPSLAKLARTSDPFEDTDVLIARLLRSKPEGKHVEWKQSCPIGPNVTKRTKYRVVKALVSFANTAGGFVICGVAPSGQWTGLDEEDLTHVDPAKLSELINGVIAPEIPHLNYREIQHDGKLFIVLHTPPSKNMPHVTTKEVSEKLGSGARHTLIMPKAVYCRFGAKSDLATPASYQQIISKRTEFLRDELLRRIREVPVPVPVPSKSAPALGPGTALRVTRITDDPSAPAVRLTHKRSEASGIFVHEELADGLFDKINNVLEANRLLARGQNRFFFGDSLYYRVYAERQHVEGDTELFEMLATTALRDLYAPGLFWLNNLEDAKCAQQLFSLYCNPKNPNVHYLLRIASLFGREFSRWLFGLWQEEWRNHPQPPDFYWTFQKMLNRKDTNDPVLIALRSKPDTKFAFPDADPPLTYGTLLESPPHAAKLLSHACMREFEQDHRFRSPARQLDFLAYGLALVKRGAKIAPIVIDLVQKRDDHENIEQDPRTVRG